MVLFLGGCGAVLVNEGSKNEPLTDGLKNPEAAQVKIKVPDEQKVIGDFENGSTSMNPKLFGDPSGMWYIESGANVNMPFVVPGGANGTKMAVHVSGTLHNKGDNSYPAFALQGLFKSTGYYDASNFDGIRYYYKCPADDKAPTRRFNVPIGQTLPTNNGGTCTDGCYNHFGYDLSPTGDNWKLITLNFKDLTRQSGWGSPVAPPDFTDHLKEIRFIEWTHNAQNTAGDYPIDYWVDEVEFF